LSADALKPRFLRSIDEIPAAQWNAIAPDYPFLRHEFLHVLEVTGCVSPATGWTPRHLALFNGEQLVAAAPLYEKSHSWGEFVFDFSWARAFQDRGIPYYPKLLLALPFTPTTGPRLLVNPRFDALAVQSAALKAVTDYAQAHGRTSAHALFLDAVFEHGCREAGWLLRSDCQFHWRNRGYRDFEDFLATFSADKRKKARRERRRVQEQGVSFITRYGHELSEAELDWVYRFHADTFARHGHLPYLNLECLRGIAAGLGPSMIVKLAMHRETPVAAAVFFRSADSLFGRYWGASDQFHSLHFETCYHQGIELCIELGLRRFEPGTQGEHKLARGFEPTLTWSAHWIDDPVLKGAVANFLRREMASVQHYVDETAAHLPFRK
jgi:predicted N-acyltransferase